MQLFCVYGCPSLIISDQGREFINQMSGSDGNSDDNDDENDTGCDKEEVDGEKKGSLSTVCNNYK